MERKKTAIAYYITPHGFGHAVRSLEILRRIVDLGRDIEPTIISDIPDALVEHALGRLPDLRRLRLDVGLYQCDSIRFDLEKSLALLLELDSASEAIIDREVDFLRREGVGVVVSDIAWLPFEAAYRCGVPSIGVGNFTWDWIYNAYAARDRRWGPVISNIRRGYEKCSLFLQLPMHGDCSACPAIEDVPMVARLAKNSRQRVRSILGLRPEHKVVLVSLVTLHLEESALHNLKRLDGIVFLYKSPLELDIPGALRFDGAPISFPDAVGAADAVITKPGYGVVSDCIAQGTPIVYTERGLFPEYEVLVNTIESELASVFIDAKDFSAGNWGPSIRQVLSLPRKSPGMRLDGADVCARRILEFMNWECTGAGEDYKS